MRLEDEVCEAQAPAAERMRPSSMGYGHEGNRGAFHPSLGLCSPACQLRPPRYQREYSLHPGAMVAAMADPHSVIREEECTSQ